MRNPKHLAFSKASKLALRRKLMPQSLALKLIRVKSSPPRSLSISALNKVYPDN